MANLPRLLPALIGAIISIAVLWRAWRTGKTWGRGGIIITMADHPTNFRIAMIFCMLLAVFFALVVAASLDPARLPRVAHIVHVPGY